MTRCPTCGEYYCDHAYAIESLRDELEKYRAQAVLDDERIQKWIDRAEAAETERGEWMEAAVYEKDEKLKAWSERNALRLKVNSLEQTVLNLSERLWELGGCPEREAAWPPDDVAADELRKTGL